MIRAALVLSCLALPAWGSQCGPRDLMVAPLAQKYAESPVARGLTSSGNVMEVYANEGTGTWTIIVTTPQGMTCFVGAGNGYESLMAEKIKSGERL